MQRRQSYKLITVHRSCMSRCRSLHDGSALCWGSLSIVCWFCLVGSDGWCNQVTINLYIYRYIDTYIFSDHITHGWSGTQPPRLLGETSNSSDPKRDSMVVVVVSMGALQFCSQNMSKLNVVELFVYLTIYCIYIRYGVLRSVLFNDDYAVIGILSNHQYSRMCLQ